MADEALRFARGWLLTRADASGTVPAHWRPTALRDGWTVWADTTVDVAFVEGARWVLFIGHAVDLDIGHTAPHQHARRLAAVPPGHDADFFRAMAALAGRHAVVHGDGTRVRVVHDATGMRSVFHAEGVPVAGSHALLVSLHSGLTSPSPLSKPGIREHLKYGWPGRRTAWEGVHLLLPNTELDIDTGQIRRFHPDGGPAPQTVESAARALRCDLRRHADALHDGRPVSVSLTAGLDTRTTLAALAPIAADLHFFTYHAGPVHDLDAEVASEIAARLGLRHEVLHVRDHAGEAGARFRQVLLDNSQYVHHPRLADEYRRRFSDPRRLHIRSNLGEIGRCFYAAEHDLPVPATAATFAAVYAGGRPVLAQHPEVVEAFADQLAVTALADGHGLDPYDLLYWEHRMGAWHGSVVIESDPAFETTVLWNSRRMLDTLLGVSAEERRQGAVFRRLVAEQLPQLADLPINAHPRRTPAA